MKTSAVALLALALTLALLVQSSAAMLFFYLPTNREQCFQYEAVRYSFEQSVRIDAHYKVRSTVTEGTQITAYIKNPSRVLLSSEVLNNDDRDQFHFSATMSGSYQVCLLLQGTTNPVSMEMNIESERDPSALSTSSGKLSASMQEYNTKIGTVQNYIAAAMQEAEHLSERQDRFDGTVESTYSRVVWFTIINLVVMVSAGVWQVLHLKSFFKEKKIV